MANLTDKLSSLKDIQLSEKIATAKQLSDNYINNFSIEQHISGTLSVNTLSATAYNGLGDLAEKDISNLTSTSIAKSSDNKLCVNYSGIENNVSTTISSYSILNQSDKKLYSLSNLSFYEFEATLESETGETFKFMVLSSTSND